MKILLDTHTFFWWCVGDRRLSPSSRRVLESSTNIVLLSAVTAWEMATKARLGKWKAAEVVIAEMDATIEAHALTPLAVTIAHARLAGEMLVPHADPFDRVLAAQARIEGAVIVTADRAFTQMDVETFW